MDATLQAHQGGGNQRGVLGKTFAIYRSSKVIGQWKLGPFSGYAVAPSLGVDPTWFFDRAEDLFDFLTKRKAKIDPLEKYRGTRDWRLIERGDFAGQ